jgi:hypothetical protein
MCEGGEEADFPKCINQGTRCVFLELYLQVCAWAVSCSERVVMVEPLVVNVLAVWVG